MTCYFGIDVAMWFKQFGCMYIHLCNYEIIALYTQYYGSEISGIVF